MADHAQGAAVTVRHLWKVFGLAPAAERQLRDELAAGRTSDLSARHDKAAVFAVNDISFDIAPGEIFCVMGLSGSGKSTLVRLINRLIEPNFGSIAVDGTDITALDAEGLRNVRSTKIAMVFQNVALFPHRNVLENIAYPLEVRGVARRERLDEAARLLALIRLHGWGERRPGELSGGMQQRVGLARALAAAPKVLLMDEPFSALDPLIRRELQDEFRDIVSRTGVTTVFITHDFDEAVYLGGRIAIMRAGQFEQIGTPKEIIFGPASEYVRRFISAEAVLSACRASDLMEPPGAGENGTGAQCGPDLPAADVLMNFRSGSDVLHVVHDGKLLGIIHKASVPARLGAILYRHDQAKTVGTNPPPGDD